MSLSLAAARAEASRRNGARACWGEGPQPLPGPGAKSRGPKTPEGKARSAQNALKHGLRAQKFVVVSDEDPQAFAALESALVDELAPNGELQGLLATRIARAAWRLERAERIEAELFARHADRDANLGLAMIRDGNGARAFDTLLRYRGPALADLWRALRLLKALQAEAGQDRRVRRPCRALTRSQSNPKAAQTLATSPARRRGTSPSLLQARLPLPAMLLDRQTGKPPFGQARAPRASNRSNPKAAEFLTKSPTAATASDRPLAQRHQAVHAAAAVAGKALAPMHGAAVVPDGQIADLPGLGPGQLVAGRLGPQRGPCPCG
jgi:hypothetical protein